MFDNFTEFIHLGEGAISDILGRGLATGTNVLTNTIDKTKNCHVSRL